MTTLSDTLAALVVKYGYPAVYTALERHREPMSPRARFLYTQEFHTSELHRIRRHLQKLISYQNDCWLVSRRVMTITVLGQVVRPVSARFVAYRAFNGVIPLACDIVVTCGNEACCNPDHLRVVESQRFKRYVHQGKRIANERTGEIVVIQRSAAETARQLHIDQSYFNRMLNGGPYSVCCGWYLVDDDADADLAADEVA